MSEDAEVVALGTKGRLPAIHAGNAREMAERKNEIEKEKRARAQSAARERAKLVTETLEQADLAAASKALDDKPIEDMADLAVRKMAKVVLLGGQAFLPTSLKEATDAAAGWAQIAYKEAARRKALEKADDELEESPVAAAAAALRQIRSDFEKKKKKASGQ